MFKGLSVDAVIVAAGKSSRMGINKQLVEIDGLPILAHTLKAFDNVDLVDRIVLVTALDDMELFRDRIVKKYGISKAVHIVSGGSERQHSVMNGLDFLKGSCDIVLVHDGARPFVTPEIIWTSVGEAFLYGAAACAVPAKDTVKLTDPDGFISYSTDRSKTYYVQTPQAFKFEILYNAHIKAKEDGFIGTDDTVLVERIGIKVKLFRGSYENIKITTPEDVYIGEAIIKYRKVKAIE